MGRILVLLSLFFSFNSFGAVVPSGLGVGIGISIPSATVSPTITSTVSPGSFSGSGGIFHLHGGESSALTAPNFFALLRDGVAYQVSATSGKVAHCFNIFSSGRTGSQDWQLVSSTAAIATGTTGTVTLTSGVYETGAAAHYAHQTSATADAIARSAGPIMWTFGNNTFAGFQAGNSNAYTIEMDCVEGTIATP